MSEMTAIEELERKAMQSLEMPDGLNLPEQWLYQSLRLLYRSYRAGAVDREQARREKSRLLSEFEGMMLWHRIFNKDHEARRKLAPVLAAMNKSECPLCKNAVDIFTGVDLKP